MYQEVIRDVWRKKQGDSVATRAALNNQLAALRENKSKLEHAFVYDSSIDRPTYTEMRAKLLEEIALEEMELQDAALEELEIEALLDFAQDVLTNASNLWKQASLQQKQRFQQILFPVTALIEPL